MKRSQNGFSLVELLVALSIMGFALIALMKIFDNVKSSQISSEGKVDEIEFRSSLTYSP